MKIKVTKSNANGNSFILINNIPKKSLINSSIISDICNKHNTDGLIVLNSFNINKIVMDYYNNDGSWETLCINGMICSTQLLNILYSKNTFDIACGDIDYNVTKNKSLFRVNMPRPMYKSEKIATNDIEGYYINSGAKHFVIEYKKSWPMANRLISLARDIRYNQVLFPEGINVNFFKIIDDNTLEVKTYEKGIEALMNSCASGSFACAYHYHSKNNVGSKINIINLGGKFISSFNDNYTNNYIISNAIIEYHDYVELQNP